MELEGKTVIVTGASSGIGEATARRFAREGAAVVLGARRKSELERVAEEIRAENGTVAFLSGDVRDPDYAEALVDMSVSQFGGLDAAFNNAGVIGEAVELSTMTTENWNSTLEINLTGAFHGAKHQIPAMKIRGGGSIVFTSSFVGHRIGFQGMAAYGASKAGLIGLTQCLAVELGPDNIRVNALLPGGTKTPMAGDFSDDPRAEEQIAQFHALGRMANADEIASAALFLASEASSFVTGSAMLVDGGNSVLKAG